MGSVSKTMIVNILVVLAGMGAYLVDNDVIKDHPEAVALIGAAVGVINIVLRYVTVAPMKGLFTKQG